MSSRPHPYGVGPITWWAFAIACVSGFTFLECLALLQRYRLGYPKPSSLTLTAWAREGLGVDPYLRHRWPARLLVTGFLFWLAMHFLRRERT